jgi:hypothetical protein
VFKEVLVSVVALVVSKMLSLFFRADGAALFPFPIFNLIFARSLSSFESFFKTTPASIPPFLSFSIDLDLEIFLMMLYLLDVFKWFLYISFGSSLFLSSS